MVRAGLMRGRDGDSSNSKCSDEQTKKRNGHFSEAEK
jgi:hypothetical protein